MITTLMPEARHRYHNNDGTLAAGAKLWTYAAGTTNLKTAYKDADGVEAHENPITLDAKGEAVIFWNGAYKVDLKAADGTQITGFPVDNVRTDPAGIWDILTNFATSIGSSLLGFIAAGAGAVLRSVQSKLRDVVHVADYGAVGDGITDDTVAITKAITAGKVVVFGDHKDYLISAALPVLSNRTYRGNRARLVASSQALVAFFNANGAAVSNVEFDSLKLDGLGTFSGVGIAAKFSNANVGIFMAFGGSDWRFKNNSFTGLDRALTLKSGDQVSITGNHVLNNGLAGFSIDLITNFIVSNNIINGVLGDDNTAGTSYGKFGDGVYVSGCVGGVISKNRISRCVRIGIVLESNTGALNKDISIDGNSISDLTNSRNTESNCGIWVEGGKSDDSISITGNTVRYTGAWTGTAAYGILCFNGGTVTGNNLYGTGLAAAAGYGVSAGLGDTTVTGNKIIGFQAGFLVAGPRAETAVYTVKDNLFLNNQQYGFYCLAVNSHFDITGNVFKDNGLGLNLPGNGYGGPGLQVLGQVGYTPSATITGNTFISSANEGAVLGQLYGIIIGNQGSTPKIYGLKMNTFIFNGVIATAYPANGLVRPCCVGYDTGGGTINLLRDIIGDQFGNTCNKAPGQDPIFNSFNANLRVLGVSNSIPSTTFPTTPGSVGDSYTNNVMGANQPYGWVCTVAGTPGTWAPYGSVGLARAAVVNTTAGAALAALETNVNLLITNLKTANVVA